MSDFTYDTVLSELTAEGVRTITLNRPGQPECHEPATDRRRGCRPSTMPMPTTATRAIIFTGAGRAFCAGDDRHEHVHPETEDEARDLVEAIQRATVAIVMGPKPVVGAINGWAVGGGFEWAINCDFPIWGESAKGVLPGSLAEPVRDRRCDLAAARPRRPAQGARNAVLRASATSAQNWRELGVAWKVVPDDELMAQAKRRGRQAGRRCRRCRCAP